MSRRLFLLPLLATLVFPGTALAAHRYLGATSQQEALTFQISAHPKAIRNFGIDWDATCTSGATLADSTLVPRMRLTPRGSFLLAGVYSYSEVNSDYSADAGRKLAFTVKVALSGRVRRHGTVAGHWSAQVTVTDPATSQQVDSCSSGSVAWSALAA